MPLLSPARAAVAFFGVLVFVVLVAAGIQHRTGTTALPNCADSLQAKIEVASSGDTVEADPCVYREQVTIDKPITLKGRPGSEIRGSDEWGPNNWTSFFSNGATYYRSTDALDPFYQEDVSCEPNTEGCAHPEQVFKGGTTLTQIYSGDPSSSEFLIDSDRKVVVKDDPAKVTYEVTTRKHWVTGTPSADGVTIEGFTMKHAANEWRSGAIMSRMPTGAVDDWSRMHTDGNDWNVLSNNLSYSHGAVLSLRGDNSNIENNDISYSGQLGIHNPGDGSLVEDNKIHHNNEQLFCHVAPADCSVYDTDTDGRALKFTGKGGLTESGGMKIAGGKATVTVEGNEVYNNTGNGIWSDVETTSMRISNNRVHHNARRGIFYELSDDGEIFSNVLWENGWVTPDHAAGAAIGLGNSSRVEVYDNTLAWNADGILVLGADRKGTSWDRVRDVYIHDNTILASDYPPDPKGKFGLAWIGRPTYVFEPANNNRGERNRYWYPDAEDGLVRFEWEKTGYDKLADFNATPGEENGRYLTRSEKDAVVTNKGIPPTPEPH